MGSLSALFATFSASVGSRVLASLGLGFISFTAYLATVNAFIATVQSNWSGMGSNILAYLSLAGFTTGMGIILGCIAARAALNSLTTIGKVI